MIPSWIQTYTGKKYDVFNPDPKMICIEDIAHALSNLCRFNGHCEGFYSVAEHSVLVSKIFDDKKLALYGLLHDAAEAYIGDYCHPIKQHLENIKILEENNEVIIFDVFGLEYPFPKEVKLADNAILFLEYKTIMKLVNTWTFVEGVEDNPYHNIIEEKKLGIWNYIPEYAESNFLERFYELNGDKSG